jgi:hypothetical protein
VDVKSFHFADITKDGGSWLLTIDGKLAGRFESFAKAVQELIRFELGGKFPLENLKTTIQ